MAHDDEVGYRPQTWVPQGEPTATPSPTPAPTPGVYAPQSPYPAQPGPYAPPSPYASQPSPPAAPGPYAGPPAFSAPSPYASPSSYAPQRAFPAPSPFAQQAYYPPPLPAKTPAIVVVGFVLSFVLPLVGFVVSLVAIGRARRAGAGRGLAIGGVVAGVVMMVLSLAVVLPVFLRQREAGPRDAFAQMQSAFIDDDCSAFMSGSTPGFREQLGVATCDDFADLVALANAGPVGFGNVPITGVEMDGDVATLTTLERVALIEGQAPSLQEFEYTIVREGGTWLVDAVALGG